MRKRLGELLCEKSYLDESGLDFALDEQKDHHRPLGEILLELGYVSSGQLKEALSIQAGVESVDLSDGAVKRDATSLLPADLVSKYSVFPLEKKNGVLSVAMSDPFNLHAVGDLRFVSGCSIKRYFADELSIEKAILKYYGSKVARMIDVLGPGDGGAEGVLEGENISAAKLTELAREPSLVNLVNLVILEAIEARASDIHIEPFEREVKIKYRVDGLLIEKTPSSKRLHAAMVSRIKIMAQMDIAERFIPQDGHIEFHGNHGKVDLRVSTVPTIFGESVTMRILDRSASLMELERLGMNETSLAGLMACLRKAHGIILVTGPTGSGKTTTLYAALNKIYTPTQKIITIEDPVEYQLDGIIQMPVNPKRGLTFATGLRHILRQDPDIVMVGEIRDRETADIAVRAALTGHLVLSTLHTNDAAGAVTRLLDMGIEPFLLASSLEGVLAQRLVRQICPKCKTSYHPDEGLQANFDESLKVSSKTKLYRGAGCEECMNTGMSGRIGIFELLRITDKVREVVSQKPNADQILRAAPADHVSMRSDGMLKVLAGRTTPEEVLRVTQNNGEK